MKKKNICMAVVLFIFLINTSLISAEAGFLEEKNQVRSDESLSFFEDFFSNLPIFQKLRALFEAFFPSDRVNEEVADEKDDVVDDEEEQQVEDDKTIPDEVVDRDGVEQIIPEDIEGDWVYDEELTVNWLKENNYDDLGYEYQIRVFESDNYPKRIRLYGRVVFPNTEWDFLAEGVLYEDGSIVFPEEQEQQDIDDESQSCDGSSGCGGDGSCSSPGSGSINIRYFYVEGLQLGGTDTYKYFTYSFHADFPYTKDCDYHWSIRMISGSGSSEVIRSHYAGGSGCGTRWGVYNQNYLSDRENEEGNIKRYPAYPSEYFTGQTKFILDVSGVTREFPINADYEEANLECTPTEIKWEDVKISDDSFLELEFTVENDCDLWKGDESILDWGVESYPFSWGDWVFSGGYEGSLLPGTTHTVTVYITNIELEKGLHTGEIKVVNKNYPDDDYVIIDLVLYIAKSNANTNDQTLPLDPDESDLDGDGFSDIEDNCPLCYNPGQGDSDGDGIGDACDSDSGNDEQTLPLDPDDETDQTDPEEDTDTDPEPPEDDDEMFQLTVTIDGGDGTFTPYVSPMSGSYLPGTMVTITASPADKFVGWSGDASGTSPLKTITMDSDKTIVARFVKSLNW